MEYVTLKNGSIDIVIGTHKVLSKSIKYKNLGLLIIDEEQRFGVKQKEKIKQLKKDVDEANTKSQSDAQIINDLNAQIQDLSKYKDEQEKIDIAMRVCADHLRAVAFSIADGQLPSNAKAGYVIRRILRRAVRYAYTFLGQKQAFMYKLVNVLVEQMGAAFPELPAQQELITRVMKEEEDSFLRTLEKGINLLNGDMDELKEIGRAHV